jgi:hypothetical protein
MENREYLMEISIFKGQPTKNYGIGKPRYLGVMHIIIISDYFLW